MVAYSFQLESLLRNLCGRCVPAKPLRARPMRGLMGGLRSLRMGLRNRSAERVPRLHVGLRRGSACCPAQEAALRLRRRG